MKDKKNIIIDFLILALLVAFAVLMLLFVAPIKKTKAQELPSVLYFDINLHSSYNESQYYINFYNELFEAVILNNYVSLEYITVDNTNTNFEFFVYELYFADEFEYHWLFEFRDNGTPVLTIRHNGNYSNLLGDNIQLDFGLALTTQYILGYNSARDLYGFYFENEWITAQEYALIRENELHIYYQNIITNMENEGYDLGYNLGYDLGYDKGLSENVETGGFGLLLGSAFTAVGTLLSIELLPNISIGALVAIPIVFGVVMFIIGRRKE